MNAYTDTEFLKHLYIGLFLFVSAFSLFGSLLRLLTSWKSGRPWQNVLGSVVTGMFVGQVVFFMLVERLKEKPAFLFALTGAAGWLGTDIVDLLTRRIFKHYFGLGIGDPEKKEGK